MADFNRFWLHPDSFYPGIVPGQYQHYFADVVLPFNREFSHGKKPARRHPAGYRDSGQALPADPAPSPGFKKKMEGAGLVVCVTAICGLILPFIFPGPNKGISMYGDWINTIMAHGEEFPGMTSLDYFFRHFFPTWPVWGILVIFISFSVMVAMFIIANIHKEKQSETLTGMVEMNFSFEWFLLITMLPNLIKTDWVLLLFSAPLITFIIFYTASWKKYWWIPLLVILFFFYGANSDDLLGRDLSHTILHSGLMGLSNFLLVMASLWMFLDQRKRINGIYKQQSD